MNLIIAMSPQGGADGGSGMISTVIMFGAMFLIFYFMIIRPQQKKAKEREAMLNNLEKGDKIVTTGGIHGSVSGIEDKTILLQISDNVKIKVERSAIGVILPKNK